MTRSKDVGDSKVVQHLKDLEAKRCSALTSFRYDELNSIIDPDLVHTHASGTVDDYKGYFAFLGRGLRFLKIERRDLQVRIYGASAVMSGIQHMEIQPDATSATSSMTCEVIQVWVRKSEIWRMASLRARVLAD